MRLLRGDLPPERGDLLGDLPDDRGVLHLDQRGVERSGVARTGVQSGRSGDTDLFGVFGSSTRGVRCETGDSGSLLRREPERTLAGQSMRDGGLDKRKGLDRSGVSKGLPGVGNPYPPERSKLPGAKPKVCVRSGCCGEEKTSMLSRSCSSSSSRSASPRVADKGTERSGFHLPGDIARLARSADPGPLESLLKRGVGMTRDPWVFDAFLMGEAPSAFGVARCTSTSSSEPASSDRDGQRRFRSKDFFDEDAGGLNASIKLLDGVTTDGVKAPKKASIFVGVKVVRCGRAESGARWGGRAFLREALSMPEARLLV